MVLVFFLSLFSNPFSVDLVLNQFNRVNGCYLFDITLVYNSADTLIIPINNSVGDGGQAFYFRDRVPSVKSFVKDTVGFFFYQISKKDQYRFRPRSSYYPTCLNVPETNIDSILFLKKYNLSKGFVIIPPFTSKNLKLLGPASKGYEDLGLLRRKIRNLRFGKPRIQVVLNLLCAGSISFEKSKRKPSKIYVQSNELKM